MAKPTSFRLEETIAKRLEDRSRRTNIRRTDLVELALERFFEAHPTTDDLIETVIRHRKARAEAEVVAES